MSGKHTNRRADRTSIPSRGPVKQAAKTSKKTTTPAKRARASHESKITPSTSAHADHVLSQSLQQRLLDVFASAFPSRPAADLKKEIQTVKGHLYNRDFEAAFQGQGFLEAYALRWSPSRALGYADLLCRLQYRFQILDDASAGHARDGDREDEDVDVSSKEAGLEVTCLGGGAGAEMVAFAGALQHLLDDSTESSDTFRGGRRKVRLNLVDIADWSSVMSQLDQSLDKHGLAGPDSPQGRGPSPAIDRQGAAGGPSDARHLSTSFIQADLFTIEPERLSPLLDNTRLITLFFTLNELYTTSLPDTTSLLLSLTYLTAPGTVMLVIDSPSSYSTVGLGTSSERKYPMAWLLDHTLLDASNIGSSVSASGQKQWEKLDGEESMWWRMKRGEEGLNYDVGVELEDMRYKWHLYRRLGVLVDDPNE